MRVVVAEDHALLRAGLVELLTKGGFDVVAQVGDAESLLEVVGRTAPDAVVLDIRMPPTHSLEGLVAAKQIRAVHGASVGVLLLSQYIETQHAMDLFAEGTAGLGYLIKDRVLNPAELRDALRRVAEGGSAIDPIVVEQLLKRRSVDPPLVALTNRERDVLAAMAEGRSNQSIGIALGISDKTVEACTGRIFSKLGLEPSPDDHRRVRAVLTYLEATTPHQ